MIRPLSVLAAALLSAVPASAQTPTTPWWRGAVCYEVFVRSFYDSDGDGIGDLRGLTDKLDYIRDLGADCIWLMPISPSPSYHGYDVTNYYEVERDYGTPGDFKRLMAEAHRRGIKIIVDLVLNHASSEHPWFQSALLDSTSPYRNWFRWSTTRRTDNWHRSPFREEYYYGLFWSGMPDLNYETPAVHEEAKRIARFWLQEMGVDGFRLDAVRHLVEDGNQISNTAGTHAVLREFGTYVRGIAPTSFTIGEVWDSTSVIARYYPDQLDSYFIFQVADALVEAARAGEGAGLVAAIQEVERQLPRGRWASFLRNHDQTRTMTELRGDVARAKLAATLLLTLPGTPFLYYGEEIGMTGNKPDPRLRTPMHWARRPGVGFTTGMAWAPLHPDSFTANVEAQHADPGSLLNLYRKLIHLRVGNPALRAGEFLPLTTGRGAVLAYLRPDTVPGSAVLVVANLGTTSASVTLSSGGRVLPAGRYTANNLMGGSAAVGLVVRGDGRIRAYSPMRSLGAHESYVVQLSRTP
jgi:alpha-amylase